ILSHTRCSFFFFFNDTATTEIYTLSLHDALPICSRLRCGRAESGGAAVDSDLRCSCVIWRQLRAGMDVEPAPWPAHPQQRIPDRSEEHTSELQSHLNLVCRLLLEKKNNRTLAQAS